MIRHFFTRQFARFVLVGGLAALLNWLARLLLSVWLPFAWAVTIAYAFGMLAAFILNSVYVFPRSDKPRAAQARDFVLINLGNFPIVWLVSVQVNRGLMALGLTHYTKEIAHAIALSLPVFTTFLLYKFLAFKEKHRDEADVVASRQKLG